MYRIALIALFLVTVLGAADPVPLIEAARRDTPTSQAWKERVVVWNRSTLVDAYRRVGVHDPSWDGEAEQLLEEWTLRFSHHPGTLTSRALAALAARLLDELKCTDPLVLYCAGKSFGEVRNHQRAIAVFRAADLGLAGSAYPHLRHGLAALRRTESAIGSNPVDLATARDGVKRMANAMTKAWDAGEYTGVERNFVVHLQCEFPHPEIMSLWLDHLQIIAEQRADIWVGQHLLGWIAIKRAWMARGSGWASTVTEDGWKIFREQLALAQQHLTQAWVLDPTQPHPPTAMIAVAMASATKDNQRTWFDRAVAAEFDHPDAYAILMGALRPRWGGSHQEMLAFGRECAATKRYDTSVPFKLTDAIIEIIADARDMKQPQAAELIFADRALWTDVQAHLEHITADPAFAGSILSFRSQRVGLAWRFGERDQAIAEARELGPDLNLRALKLYDVNPETIQAAVVAATADDTTF